MKLTPHYQQQMKQTTSHFFILSAKVFIHPVAKDPLCVTVTRARRASCLHVTPLADRYRDASVSAVSHKKDKRRGPSLLARTETW